MLVYIHTATEWQWKEKERKKKNIEKCRKRTGGRASESEILYKKLKMTEAYLLLSLIMFGMRLFIVYVLMLL